MATTIENPPTKNTEASQVPQDPYLVLVGKIDRRQVELAGKITEADATVREQAINEHLDELHQEIDRLNEQEDNEPVVAMRAAVWAEVARVAAGNEHGRTKMTLSSIEKSSRWQHENANLLVSMHRQDPTIKGRERLARYWASEKRLFTRPFDTASAEQLLKIMEQTRRGTVAAAAVEISLLHQPDWQIEHTTVNLDTKKAIDLQATSPDDNLVLFQITSTADKNAPALEWTSVTATDKVNPQQQEKLWKFQRGVREHAQHNNDPGNLRAVYLKLATHHVDDITGLPDKVLYPELQRLFADLDDNARPWA